MTASRRRDAVALMAWLVFLGAALVGLHALGGGPLGTPPFPGLGRWLGETDAATALFAFVRVALLFVGWYLLVSTLLAMALRLVRADVAARAVEACAPPAVGRLVRAAAGLSLAASVVAVSAAAASEMPVPVTMHRRPEVARRPVVVDEAPPVTMTRLPEDERSRSAPTTMPPATSAPDAPDTGAVAATTSTTRAAEAEAEADAPASTAPKGPANSVTMRRLADADTPPETTASTTRAAGPTAADTSAATASTAPKGPTNSVTKRRLADADTPPETTASTTRATGPTEADTSAATASTAPKRPTNPVTMRRLADADTPPETTASTTRAAGPTEADTSAATASTAPSAPPPSAPTSDPAATPATSTTSTTSVTMLQRPGTDHDTTAAPARAAATWTVRRGDHLWAIARHTLQAAWSAEPTDAEVDPYWRAVIARNRSRLRDPSNPDLIVPGFVVDLPTPPTR